MNLVVFLNRELSQFEAYEPFLERGEQGNKDYFQHIYIGTKWENTGKIFNTIELQEGIDLGILDDPTPDQIQALGLIDFN